jgi:hypothetical protein
MTTVTLTNPSAHNMAIAINDNPSKSVFLTPLVSTLQGVSALQTHALDTRWETNAAFYSEYQLKKFIILPKQSITLNLMIQDTGFGCVTKSGEPAAGLHGFLLALAADQFRMYVFRNNETKADAKLDDTEVVQIFGAGVGKQAAHWVQAWSKETHEPENYQTVFYNGSAADNQRLRPGCVWSTP